MGGSPSAGSVVFVDSVELAATPEAKALVADLVSRVRQDGAVVRSWAGVLPGEAVPFDGHVVIDANGVEVIPR